MNCVSAFTETEHEINTIAGKYSVSLRFYNSVRINHFPYSTFKGLPTTPTVSPLNMNVLE